MVYLTLQRDSFLATHSIVMQSVESSVCTAPFDCDDLVIRHGSVRPAELFDQNTKLPHFIFTPTGSTICAYSPNRLHCQFANGKQFSWTPFNADGLFASLENWPIDAPRSWIIAEVTFLPSSSSMVVLFAPSQDVRPKRSLVCLMNISDEKPVNFTRFISLRGRAEAIHAIAVDPSVRVTLLQYVPQIKSLVVGFDFGGWQMWSLTKLQLIYTYRELPSAPVATVSCAFSEPSDDPRYCCFLWIGWQGLMSPRVVLFQLGFRKRTEHTQPNTEDTLYEYEEFYGASKRLSASLTPITASTDNAASHWSANGALLTSIQSLGTNYSNNYGLRSNRLTALVWRAAPDIVRIGLFDLDRWYYAQMPTSIRSDNSFFAVYDASLNSSRAHPLTAHILPHTIFAFWAVAYRRELCALRLCGDLTTTKDCPLRGCQGLRNPIPESQLRPSAHAFKALVPFIRDHVVACASFKFVSRQELVLREIPAAIDSPSSSIHFDPIDWITEAVACGLIQELDDSAYGIPRILKEAEGSEWITRQAIGLETPPPGLLKQMEMMDAEEEKEAADYFESAIVLLSPRGDRKRRILSDQDVGGRSSKRPRKDQQIRTSKYLSPTWVIIANCLLEHGMFKEVKTLVGLITTSAAAVADGDFNARAFMRRWLWLRWLGKKSCLEDLLNSVFSTNEGASPLSVEGIKDLSLCIHSLRALADIAEVVMSVTDRDGESGETVSAEAKLKVIRMLALYTHSICLLLRFGLLPQASEQAYRLRTSSESPLSPYDPTELSDFLAKLQSAHGSTSIPPTPPFITGRIMDHLRHLLSTAESDEETAAALESEVTTAYPPRHLRSVCALWQCFAPGPQLPLTHLALFTFLLFDTVAVNALHGGKVDEDRRRSCDSKEIQEANHVRRVRLATETAKEAGTSCFGPVARAVRLQEYVVNQLVSEFPDFENYVSTVRTLWLIDRFRFPDVLCSRLSPVAMGKVTSLSQLPEIFPDQARVVGEYCSRCGETELADLFAPTSDPLSSSPLSLLHVGNIGSCGSILPALYHARRLYFQQNDHDSAAKVLLEVADTFRKHGRFLDFINLGLTAWEADVIFSDMRRRGENRLLYACLVARAQYKEAQDLLAEVDADIVSQMSQHSTQKLSKTPVVRAMSSTISYCLPHLKYLFPFSALVNLNHSNDQFTSPIDANSTEENLTNEVQLECVEFDSTHVSPAPSTGPLLRRFVTPKGHRLSVQPSTTDKNQASEFWNYYNVAQRVLRGEKPFETRSPIKPRITDSARKLSRKLHQILYSASVVSPLPMARKRTPTTSRNLLRPSSDTSDNASLRPRSDFWTEVGKMHEAELSRPTTASATATPAASILKVRSAPLPECAKTPPPTTDAAESDASFQDCRENTPSLEVDEDDVEVTINPHTLQLDRKFSLARSTAEEPVISGTIPVVSSSSTMFTFSPPNRTVISRPGQMDEVARALCSNTHFTFASPATYLMKKFLSSTSGASSPKSEVEKEEASIETSYRFTSTSGVEDVSSACEPQDEVSEDPGEADVEDTGGEAGSAGTGDARSDGDEAPVATDEGETSTHPETEEDEQSEAGLQPPRRSRRHVKRPERYRY
ncbi:Protein ELYS [Taenia solium]